MVNIEIVEKNNITTFSDHPSFMDPWMYHFMKHYIADGMKKYIANADHEVKLAIVNGKLIPLIINSGKNSDCYLTASSINYLKYAKDFVLSLESRWLRFPLLGIIFLFESLIRKEALDKIIYINNWGMATGPAIKLTHEEMDALIDVLKKDFKDYAFVCKGVRQEEIDAKQFSHGKHFFRPIFTRQIYLWSSKSVTPKNIKRDFKRDKNFLLKNLSLIQPLANENSDEQLKSLVELYSQLYVGKYSKHNPLYTEAWFSLMLNHPGVEMYGIHIENKLVYFISCFLSENELISSVIGYNNTLPKELRLYRLGSSYLMKLSEQYNKILNLSSGAGKFKLNRGAQSVLQYELVCSSHLSLYKRFCWFIIAQAYNTIALRLFTMLAI